jgi:hypothetical protein
MGNSFGVSVGQWPGIGYHRGIGIVPCWKNLLSNDLSNPEHRDEHHCPWKGGALPPTGGRGNKAWG